VNGFEKHVDNCSTTADDDTQLDPWSRGMLFCFPDRAAHTRTCVDTNGASNFSPFNNVMSYWWLGGCAAEF
jgi:hypothetical protein